MADPKRGWWWACSSTDISPPASTARTFPRNGYNPSQSANMGIETMLSS